MSMSWSTVKGLVNDIKEILFATNLIDPTSYSKSEAEAAKHLHNKFQSINNSLWLSAFRRAATEHNLKAELEEIEARHRYTSQLNPATQAAAAKESHAAISKNVRERIIIIAYFSPMLLSYSIVRRDSNKTDFSSHINAIKHNCT